MPSPEVQHLAVRRPQPGVEVADELSAFDLAQTPELQRGERIKAKVDLDLAPTVPAQAWAVSEVMRSCGNAQF